MGDTVVGRVLATSRGFATVSPPHGEAVLATLAPKLGEPPVVGDEVALDPDAAVVRAVLPRHGGVLARADGALVANLDLALLVVPSDGPPDERRLERLAAVAAGSGLEVVVVVTKADTGDPERALALARRTLPGATVLVCSARTGEGVDAVRSLLAPGRLGALVGRSGAGKSSLVNALLGAEVQAIAAIRQRDGEGRHTTTNAELLPLPGGGALVDLPGLKLPRMAAGADVEAAFADVAELAEQCRFGDCSHSSEPDCAVRGGIDPARLAQYRRLVAEERVASEREVEKRKRERDGSRTVRAKGRRP